MVSTRSKTAQTYLEGFVVKDSAPKSQQKPASPKQTAPRANTSRKRKSIDADTAEGKQTPKRAKTSEKPKDGSTADEPVIINRAPVLHLWSACVAHFTYPQLSWETCLSAGSAVSSVCAVAKGRAIGTVPEKDDSEPKSEKARKKQKGTDEIEVMHFKLRLKDGLCAVGSDSKGKPGNEEGARKKFGEGEYERVKGAFDDTLESWKGEEEELNRKGFHMYEAFRPDVDQGQQGWGRKGELNLETVSNTVRKQ